MMESKIQDHLALLAKLYRDELRERPDEYLQLHAGYNSMLRQISVFRRYLPFLPAKGVLLDWGCRHAPDACLIRQTQGDSVELHGCDFYPEDMFPNFHHFADLKYRQLTNPFILPYDDASFDAVIGTGVLEHTANDSESLKELHRILKEEGILVLTFLPNRLSYTEFLSRRLQWPHHRRLYGLRAARALMLHHGFEPLVLDYHQMVPGQQLQRLFGRFWFINSFLERAWPLNRLSSNLMMVCRRLSQM
jgi:SAM-dependent methyltransferase